MSNYIYNLIVCIIIRIILYIYIHIHMVQNRSGPPGDGHGLWVGSFGLLPPVNVDLALFSCPAVLLSYGLSWTVFHVDLDLDLVEFLCQRFEWCLQFWGADMPRARRITSALGTTFGFELYWHEFQRVIHVAWALVLNSLMPQPFAQDLMACQRHYEPSLGLRFWELAKPRSPALDRFTPQRLALNQTHGFMKTAAGFLGLRWLGQLDWESLTLVLDQPWSKSSDVHKQQLLYQAWFCMTAPLLARQPCLSKSIWHNSWKQALAHAVQQGRLPGSKNCKPGGENCCGNLDPPPYHYRGGWGQQHKTRNPLYTPQIRNGSEPQAQLDS